MMKMLVMVLGVALLAMPAQAADNSLTGAEKRAGWVLLFDGKTTQGWRGFKDAEVGGAWKAEDGVLSPDPKAGRDLVTQGDYADFELRFEWRISARGNSGVMFRVIPEGTQTYQSGPEYQVLDNAVGFPPKQQAGSLFDLVAPSRDVTRPVGEWNAGRLIVERGKVEHWLNGERVAAYEIGSPEFKSLVAASKFRQWPQFATGMRGAIALQNHGDAVGFRNLKIRELK